MYSSLGTAVVNFFFRPYLFFSTYSETILLYPSSVHVLKFYKTATSQRSSRTNNVKANIYPPMMTALCIHTHGSKDIYYV